MAGSHSRRGKSNARESSEQSKPTPRWCSRCSMYVPAEREPHLGSWGDVLHHAQWETESSEQNKLPSDEPETCPACGHVEARGWFEGWKAKGKWQVLCPNCEAPHPDQSDHDRQRGDVPMTDKARRSEADTDE